MAKVDIDVGVKTQRFASGLDALRATARRFSEGLAKTPLIGGGSKGMFQGAEKLGEGTKEFARNLLEARDAADVLQSAIGRIAGTFRTGLIAGGATAAATSLYNLAKEAHERFAAMELDANQFFATFRQGLRSGDATQIIASVDQLAGKMQEYRDVINEISAQQNSNGLQSGLLKAKDALLGLVGSETSSDRAAAAQDRLNQALRMRETAGIAAADAMAREHTVQQQLIDGHVREAEEIERKIALKRKLEEIDQKFDGPVAKRLKMEAEIASRNQRSVKDAERNRTSDATIRANAGATSVADLQAQHDLDGAAALERKLELEKEIVAVKLKGLTTAQQEKELASIANLIDAKANLARKDADYAAQQLQFDQTVAMARAGFFEDAAQAMERMITFQREMRELSASEASDAQKKATGEAKAAVFAAQDAQQRQLIGERQQKAAAELAMAQKLTVADDLKNGLSPRARATLRNQIARDQLSQAEKELGQLSKGGRVQEADAKRREIEGLRRNVNASDLELERSQFSASVVASSKASVGLGGGVAIFGANDTPRQQLTVQQQILAALTNYQNRSATAPGKPPTNTKNF